MEEWVGLESGIGLASERSTSFLDRFMCNEENWK